MHIIGYHGTKVDVDDFTTSDISFDRMVGPHFSKTPALANRFALKNPGRKGHGKRYGGRVIPVRLAGAIYKVNQQYSDFPGAYSQLSHPETGCWIGLFAADYHAIAHDIGKVVFPERADLVARLAQVFGHPDADACLTHIRKTGEWGMAGYIDLKDHRDLQADIARAYRDILVERGYGVLQYVNTAKKEQVGGLEDQTCYIALAAPRFYFKAVH
jgi:hypothetical protein